MEIDYVTVECCNIDIPRTYVGNSLVKVSSCFFLDLSMSLSTGDSSFEVPVYATARGAAVKVSVLWAANKWRHKIFSMSKSPFVNKSPWTSLNQDVMGVISFTRYIDQLRIWVSFYQSTKYVVNTVTSQQWCTLNYLKYNKNPQTGKLLFAVGRDKFLMDNTSLVG